MLRCRCLEKGLCTSSGESDVQWELLCLSGSDSAQETLCALGGIKFVNRPGHGVK